jgi:hypothetical protein
MGKSRGAYRVLMKKYEEKRNLGDLGVEEKIILKFKSEKEMRCLNYAIWVRIGTSSGQL